MTAGADRTSSRNREVRALRDAHGQDSVFRLMVGDFLSRAGRSRRFRRILLVAVACEALVASAWLLFRYQDTGRVSSGPLPLARGPRATSYARGGRFVIHTRPMRRNSRRDAAHTLRGPLFATSPSPVRCDQRSERRGGYPGGRELLLALLRQAYCLEGAGDRFSFCLTSGGPAYHLKPAIAFLRHHLRDGTRSKEPVR